MTSSGVDRDTIAQVVETSNSQALKAVNAFLSIEKENIAGYIDAIVEESKKRNQYSTSFETFLSSGEMDKRSSVWNSIRVLSGTPKMQRPMLVVAANLITTKKLEDGPLKELVSCVLRCYEDESTASDSKLVLELLIERGIQKDRIERSISEIDDFRTGLKKLEGLKVEFLKPIGTPYPHPTTQTQSEIKQILKERTEKAIQLLESNQPVKFLSEIVDPFELLDSANMDQMNPRCDVRRTFLHLAVSIEQTDDYAKILLEKLKAQDPSKFKFWLGGRVVVTDEKYNASFWCFREGNWYWNGAAMPFGGGGPSAKPIDLRFFSDKPEENEFDLQNEKSRLDSLRAAQAKAIKLLDESPTEFVKEIFSPYSIAYMSVACGKDLQESSALMIEVIVSNRRNARSELRSAIELMRTSAPSWKLNGRAAVYSNGREIALRHHFVWELIEGRWRLAIP